MLSENNGKERKKLNPKLKEARVSGKDAWIAYDTHFIIGKPVKA